MGCLGPFAVGLIVAVKNLLDVLLGGITKNVLLIRVKVTTQVGLSGTSSLQPEAVFINKSGNITSEN